MVLNDSPAAQAGGADCVRAAQSADPTIAFFVQDLADSCTIKRAQQFIDQGCRVVVFGFRRFRYNHGYAPPWPHVVMGHTSDRRYWRRISALLSALAVVYRNRRRLRAASAIYARNIDQLVLALAAAVLFGLRKPIAYEILDVQPILARRGGVSRLLRAIERVCLGKIRLLVLSSPGFHRNYYGPVQRYAGPWHLLENKLQGSAVALLNGVRPNLGTDGSWRRGYRWVVGYHGLIRGQATFDLMTRVAERLRDVVLFKFRGVLTTVDKSSFDAALRRNPNMVYEGEYVVPDDLGTLYGNVDFAWAIDLEHVDCNSRWLLPCRFYEAGLFGVPCLGAKGFELGDMLDRLGAGWTFAAPYEEEIVAFLQRLGAAEYGRVRAQLQGLPMSTFVHGEDVARLCRAVLPASSPAADRSDDVLPGPLPTPSPAG